MVLTLRKKHIVLDNNIIFDFGAHDNFILLNKILADSSVLMSPEVKEEVKKEVKIESLRFRLVAYASESDYKYAGRLKSDQKGLAAADISCLVLAKKHAAICVSNDKLVRRVAKQEGISVMGSIGLLECAVSLRILTRQEAGQILRKMKEKGAFIEEILINQFLERRSLHAKKGTRIKDNRRRHL